MFNKKQMSLIIGSLLGDGSLTKTRYNKTNGNIHSNSQLTIQHSGKQLEYLNFKRDLFIANGFKVTKVYDVTRGSYPSYRFNVSLGKEGNVLRHQIYPNNNKTITRSHLNLLDEQGLAIWFMDDGCRRVRWLEDGRCGGRSLHISTHNFTYEEQELMVKYFKVVWDFGVKIYKDRDKFRLNINATNAKIFIPIIEPYMHETMKYKVDLMYKDLAIQSETYL